jgi:hypothetical protein
MKTIKDPKNISHSAGNETGYFPNNETSYAIKKLVFSSFLRAWASPTATPDKKKRISGERYDVVLEAFKPPGSYWIHVKGLATCVSGRVYQVGVLQYEDATTEPRVLPTDPGYNGFTTATNRVSYRTINLVLVQTQTSRRTPNLLPCICSWL